MTAKLRGVRDSRPCWWCSRKLRGGHGKPALVDGHERIFHGECLDDARRDEDMAGRVEALGKVD